MNETRRPAPETTDIDAQLRRTEAICDGRSVRLTPMRRAVYRSLLESARPMTAYDLLDRLSEAQGRRLAPPTIYRALEFLMDQGLLHRLESLNAYVVCEQPGQEHDSVFYVCGRCQRAVEISDGRVGHAVFENAQLLEFTPIRQVVEIHGVCKDCLAD